MELALWFGMFALALTALVVSARFFTNAAETIGLALGMSAFATGVIIVSIGTSLPELVASVLSVRAGASEIVAGNILGASVSNLFFVLGTATLFARKAIHMGDQYIAIDLNFLVGTAFLVALTCRDGRFTLPEGILALCAYGVYVYYLLREGNADSEGAAPKRRASLRPQEFAILGAAGLGIYVGGNYTILALERLSDLLHISKAIASVTILSVGTTLPEVVISAVAARQGKGDVAIGNILGSCIFNGLAVSGIASFFGTITIPPAVLALPLPVYGGAILLFYLLAQDKKFSRWEGLLFLILYVLFMGEVAGLF
jgi:cation:H+ antiporter